MFTQIRRKRCWYLLTAYAKLSILYLGADSIKMDSSSNTLARIPVLVLDLSVYHFMTYYLRTYMEVSLLRALFVFNAAVNVLPKLNFVLMASRRGSKWEATTGSAGISTCRVRYPGLKAVFYKYANGLTRSEAGTP